MTSTTAGQQAYERDVAKAPRYHDGQPRRAWQDIGAIAQWSWERNPTDREWQPRATVCST